MAKTLIPVTLPNTEVHLVQSSYTDQQYKLFISLPEAYNGSEDAYPVLYVTDANAFFSIFSAMVPLLPIPPMIIVGIGYPIDGFANVFRLRAKDFLPTKNKEEEKVRSELYKIEIESGGASSFLSFVREELFSFVNSRYRTKADDRTLWCYSFGGTFGIYTLFKYPDTFSRYIIGAPDLMWDDRVCFTYEREYAEQSTDLATKLYLCVGTLDEDLVQHNASQLIEFHAILNNRKYANLDMEFGIFIDETHPTSVLPSISKGLRSVFG